MSEKVSQKDAVVREIKNILGSSFNPDEPARDQLTKDQLATVKSNVTSGIVNGEIEFNKETTDEKEIATYVSGMVSNHLRKAKELNGGTKYTPKTSGKGSRDPQIAELNKLLQTYEEGTEEYDQIVRAIESRKEELAKEKEAAAKEQKRKKELDSLDKDILPDRLKNIAEELVNESAES